MGKVFSVVSDVKRHPVFHYSVDYIFWSFVIIDYILRF